MYLHFASLNFLLISQPRLHSTTILQDDSSTLQPEPKLAAQLLTKSSNIGGPSETNNSVQSWKTIRFEIPVDWRPATGFVADVYLCKNLALDDEDMAYSHYTQPTSSGRSLPRSCRFYFTFPSGNSVSQEPSSRCSPPFPLYYFPFLHFSLGFRHATAKQRCMHCLSWAL